MDLATRRLLIRRLDRDAARLAHRFGLRYQAIEAERANVKNRYGICDSDGLIKIRLRHVTTGRPLKYSSLINTLCHELAHLRHFDHGLRFRSFYQEILDFAREQGIYRPGSVRGQAVAPPARPRRAAQRADPAKSAQLSLF